MKKKIGLWVSVCLALILLVGCGSSKNQSVENTDNHELSSTPTLFVHGYGGGKGSFNGMIKRFEKDNKASRDVLITVSKSGEIHTENEKSSDGLKENNPMIQVIFEDNENNEWEQAAWLNDILIYLKEHYGVDEVNIVGHSMGGVSGLRLLTQTPINSNRPMIKKFVAIGSPFNDFIDTFDEQNLDELLKNGPTEESERFILYQAEVPSMPKETEVLLIGGALSDTDQSDGTVPLSSALSVHHMLKNNGNKTQYLVVEGKSAGHSALHENTEVDQKVSEFLYLK